MDSFSEDRKYLKPSQIDTQVFWKSSPQAPTVHCQAGPEDLLPNDRHLSEATHVLSPGKTATLRIT